METTSNKIHADAHSALEGILFDGMSIMAGGFGACGIPDLCIREIRRRQIRDLTIISNNCGGEYFDRPGEGFGLWGWLQDHMISKAICSYIGTNRTFERQHLDKTIDLELSPQGTLAERIRAGGAGIGGFYTPTGVGTVIAEDKETRDIDGTQYVLETGITADLAIVKAWKADPEGNLVYRKTARNFNPMMATAGKITVAEVEHIVAAGELDPDGIHTPGVFVQRLFQGQAEKIIEQRTTRERHSD